MTDDGFHPPRTYEVIFIDEMEQMDLASWTTLSRYLRARQERDTRTKGWQMGKQVYLHCVPCDEQSGAGNNAVDECCAFMRQRALIDAVNTGELGPYVDLTAWRYFFTPTPLSFLREHQGHEVRVMDDLGNVYNEDGSVRE